MESTPTNPDIDRALALAKALHGNGRLPEAERLYRQILQMEPRQHEALHLLGLLARQAGQPGAALALIGQALEVQPQSADYRNSQGLCLQDTGELQAAIRSFREALALNDGSAVIHYNFANALRDSGDFEAALVQFQRALALQPDLALAQLNIANVLVRLGRLDDALLACDAALALQPGMVQAWTNQGNILDAQARWNEALASYERALALQPGFAPALRGRGKVLAALGRDSEAVVALHQWLSLEPRDIEALNNLAVALMRLNRLEESLTCCHRVLAIDARHVAALSNRGNLLKALRRYEDAAQCFEALTTIAPGAPYALGSLLRSRSFTCDWRDFDDLNRRLCEAVRQGHAADIPFSFLAASASAEEQRRCARAYLLDKFPRPAAPALPAWPARPRIHLAYVSADFQNHPSMHLMAGLFERHDHARFEISAISLGPDSDHPMRQRVARCFDGFVDARSMTDDQVAGLMREMKVDIAIDLNGYTQGGRPGIFALRAAPLQVSYLGYPGTLGADFIDYLLADAHVIPPAQRTHYSEAIACLPGCYQATDDSRVPDPAPLSRAAAGLPEAGFVFCCFNNNYKITPAFFTVWMRLLAAVPGSVLWLLQDNEAAGRNLRAEAALRGIDPARLVFAARVDAALHLARHRLADLFLDTLPYNAHTTASDALWMGLPLLSCRGEAFAARVASSLLLELGLPELVTDSLEDYEHRALALARSPAELQRVKDRLVRAGPASGVFDTARFARRIESAFEQMWRRSQAAQVPADFVVGAD